ncbi:dihydroxyacetone kinase [Exidia glandulosa HHB12029]|uniref:Dihydroxyacetone kinase n=1 Tax=Exidia glandulosa HHB12029 TaxID=1314781 RepID=A0A165JBA7_EXIGL|nr:dihydroxyacetone kinase [Exidia glandulosa HHB12029]
MLAKHLLNAPGTLVTDALEGLTRTNPRVQLDVQNKVLYQTDLDRSKVALICGGGAGHEPAHAGFVGKGILTAAVSGNIFASPNASQVLRAIELVDTDTLIIIKNYTGDILNFGLAREKYLALHPERADRVKFLVVGDDVSVTRSQGGLVGRRGLAGTVLVYKIAGALAARGAPLQKVNAVAEWVASRLGTIGAGLDHCHVPGTEAREGHLGADEIEIGMGIHNESGYQRVTPIPPLKELIPNLLDLITSTSDKERSFVPFGQDGGKGDKVVLLVNNLGGLSELELSGIAQEATVAAHTRGLTLERVIVGTFMTSLNMPGFSLTILLLPRDGEDAPASAKEIVELLDEPADAPGWSWMPRAPPNMGTTAAPTAGKDAIAEELKRAKKLPASDPAAFDKAVRAACDALVAAEGEITELDSIAGDGDCGITLRNGAQGVLEQIDRDTVSGTDVVSAVISIAQACEAKMDGTSGALYSIWFSALAQGLQSSSTDAKVADATVWRKALSSALEKLYTYTPARPPSRTLVDPLDAFVQTLSQNAGLREATDAAGKAAEKTKELPARAGRATYVESERLKGIMDPGAMGLKVAFEAIATAVGV